MIAALTTALTFCAVSSSRRVSQTSRKEIRKYCISIEDVREAMNRIRDRVHRTPVLTCSSLDEQSGMNLFFKCELFQKTGSFKIRGATNACFALTDEQAKRGVITHSSGNHAQAVALAARCVNKHSHFFFSRSTTSE